MINNEDVMTSRQLAGRVTRYHTWPMIRRPTVAEHAARVATLYCELWGLPRAEVLYYCLHHDNGELAAGDVPFGAKRRVPGMADAANVAEKMGLLSLGVQMPELTEQEHKQFKMADYLEMWECAVVEANMGNRYALTIIQNLQSPVRELAAKLCETSKIIRWMERNQPYV